MKDYADGYHLVTWDSINGHWVNEAGVQVNFEWWIPEPEFRKRNEDPEGKEPKRKVLRGEAG